MRFMRRCCARILPASAPTRTSVPTRAAMADRLNEMLVAPSGVQPAVAEKYVQFLNLGVTPAMPAEGSMGEADITILSHIGLVMMGEGDAYYHRRQDACSAGVAGGRHTTDPAVWQGCARDTQLERLCHRHGRAGVGRPRAAKPGLPSSFMR